MSTLKKVFIVIVALALVALIGVEIGKAVKNVELFPGITKITRAMNK